MPLAVPESQVLNRIEASLQYPIEQASIADSWLTDWVQQKLPNIRPHSSNGHALKFLVPPHVEGCTAQVDVEYHFTHASAAEFDADADVARAAIYDGSTSPFTVASCDSSWTTTSE